MKPFESTIPSCNSSVVGSLYGNSSYNRDAQHIIRNARSKEYFNHGCWTPEMNEAQRFRSSETAMAVAIQCGLSNVELVLEHGLERF